MNPDQSFPEPPQVPTTEPEKITPTHNPYEFIVNPQKPLKKSKVAGGNSSFALKLAFIIGGAVIIMIFLAIMSNILFGSRTNPAELISIAETQTELARVAGQGASANDAGLRGAAANAQLVMTSQQQALVNYLKQQGTKVNAKQLSLKQSATTDKQLTAASAANTFDAVFAQTMVSELQDYRAALRTAYQHEAGVHAKALLSSDFTEASLLLKQWPATN